MNNNAKRILLARKFTSLEYVELFVDLYDEMVDAMESGMNEFIRIHQLTPSIDPHNIDDWVKRGLPNIKGGAYRSREHLKNKNLSGVSSSAGNLRSLSKDVDNIGGFGEWWQHIDEKFEKTFNKCFKLTKKTGNNIYYTFRDSWQGDNILDEEITGPIDEIELLNYLTPNEN